LLPKRIYVLFIQESPPTPLSTLFPYTTLFRSRHSGQFLRRAGLGYHQPQEPPPAQGLRLSRVAERRLGVSPAAVRLGGGTERARSEEHTSELQSHLKLVWRLPLEKKKYVCYSA